MGFMDFVVVLFIIDTFWVLDLLIGDYHIFSTIQNTFDNLNSRSAFNYQSCLGFKAGISTQ
jgi:hypothetical protein